MNPRERILALLLLGAIVLTATGALGYFFVWEPLNRQRADEAKFLEEINELETQAKAQEKTAARLAVTRKRSLPADEQLARREYMVALERMIEAAGVPKGYTITPKSVDNTARGVPEIAKNKPLYTRIAYEVVFKKVDMKVVKEFLQRYYQFGLLHQITTFSIKKEDDPSAKGANRRNDLTVTFVTEGIIVEGAEDRKTLVPVPTAFAAIGGAAIFTGIATNYEYARGVTPQLQVPVLATNKRDYDLMVRKDPFNGPLPVEPEPSKEKPFKMDKIRDVVVKTDKEPSPVRVWLSGEGSTGAKVTAIASGELYAEGALKVDPKTYQIELPMTSATEGTATISVIATTADGSKTEKTSFKVSLEEVTKPPSIPKEDVSFAIILIGTTPRSDGTAWARVFDNANRLRYTIEADTTKIKVLKEYRNAGTLPWKKDLDYDHPAGQLVISDDDSSTNRTFKVIAIDSEGLIIADLKPDGSVSEKPKAPGKGGWPPGGGGKGPPKQGKGNPLAAIGGNMIVAISPPKFYRWSVGSSLAALKPLTDDEAKKIQKAVATSGPVFDVATAP